MLGSVLLLGARVVGTLIRTLTIADKKVCIGGDWIGLVFSSGLYYYVNMRALRGEIIGKVNKWNSD